MSRPPYFPVECRLFRHPKIIKLKQLAGRSFYACLALWLEMGCMCIDTGSGGRVTRDQARSMRPRDRTLNSQVAFLSSAGMLDLEGDDYRLHNWDMYNETEAETAYRKAANKRRKRNQRDRERLAKLGSESGSESRSESLNEAALRAVENELCGQQTGKKETVSHVTPPPCHAPLNLNNGTGAAGAASVVEILQKLNIQNNNSPSLDVSLIPELRPGLDWHALQMFCSEAGWVLSFSSSQRDRLEDVRPSISELIEARKAVERSKQHLSDKLSYALGVVVNARKNGVRKGNAARPAKSVTRDTRPEEPAFGESADRGVAWLMARARENGIA